MEAYFKRLPPGQVETKKFPVLHEGDLPNINLKKWRLHVYGLVNNTYELTYEELLKLPKVESVSDFHCVTGWSRFDNRWEGVSVAEIIRIAEPAPEALYVIFLAANNYSTSLSVSDVLPTDVLLAYKWQDKPLTLEHGWPLRLVVPHKYGYKSAKWVYAVKLTKEKELGFWEQRGYSDSADPWKEERYST